MFRFILSVALGLLISCLVLEVAAQSPQARCFQFTWLGPRFNNESVFLNATCNDATRLASGVPCFEPLVASCDGSWPDVQYIWSNHLLNASCIMASNDICATYTYYFNGQVENSTYMCTRAVDSNNHAITSGCYTQRNGSFTTKACFCRSIPGGVPCNGSGAAAIISAIVTVIASVILCCFVNIMIYR